jgi:hypothetical protein
MNHRCILLIVCAFSKLVMHAQSPFEYADQRTHVVHYSQVMDHGGGWTVGGSAGEEKGVNSYGLITHFNTAGDTAWNILVGGFPGAMVNATNDRVLATGMMNGCDAGPWNLSFLMSIAVDGSTDWMKQYAVAGAHDLALSPSGATAVLGMDAILITNNFGDSITTWPVGTGMRRVFWETDTTLLLITDMTVERRGATGAILTSVSLPPNITGAIFVGGDLLALSANGELFTLDSSLNTLDTTALGSTFSTGYLIATGDSLIAIGDDNILLLDSALTILSTNPWDPMTEFQGVTFTSAAATSAVVAMVGYHGFHSRSSGIFRTVNIDGSSISHPIDVGIEVASVDSTWYTGTLPIIYPKALVSIRLWNNGTETVDDVVLNAFFGGWICSDAGITSRFGNLQLPPGADTVLTGIEPVLSYGPVTSVQHQDFCIAVLSPNHLLDRDESDNLACDSIHIGVGIADAFKNAAVLIPNPFGDRLELRFPTPTNAKSRLWLFDPNGRVMLERVVPIGTEQLKLDASALGVGPFLLRLEGPGLVLLRTVLHLED